MKNKILGVKRGYLKKDFELFHLKDRKDLNFEFHYHNFNKIIIFMRGNVTYFIEGKSYKLKPWDILLIGKNDVHMPIIDPTKIYERIILWINSSFLLKYDNECHLLNCFDLASKRKVNLLRLNNNQLENIKKLAFQIESTFSNKFFGYKVLRLSLFLQFIVAINRLFLKQKIEEYMPDILYDKNIANVIGYINDNLNKDLSINSISARFYLNKYYLMHKFKNQTGYTIHNYIIQKRLIMSNILIENGDDIFHACIKSGFKDYSSFVRAFKKTFGLSPRKYHKNQ